LRSRDHLGHLFSSLRPCAAGRAVNRMRCFDFSGWARAEELHTPTEQLRQQAPIPPGKLRAGQCCRSGGKGGKKTMQPGIRDSAPRSADQEGTMSLHIRQETPADQDSIRHVNRVAFGQDEEARLVDALRDGGHVRLSLVAERECQVVGHILFSALPILTEAGTVPALALAPMAVLPGFQNQGIGSALVRSGLEACREHGHRIVVVVGHPHFYPRFGFCSNLTKRLASPYPGEAFMAVELVAGALDGVTGRVEYPPPFDGV